MLRDPSRRSPLASGDGDTYCTAIVIDCELVTLSTLSTSGTAFPDAAPAGTKTWSATGPGGTPGADG